MKKIFSWKLTQSSRNPITAKQIWDVIESYESQGGGAVFLDRHDTSAYHAGDLEAAMSQMGLFGTGDEDLTKALSKLSAGGNIIGVDTEYIKEKELKSIVNEVVSVYNDWVETQQALDNAWKNTYDQGKDAYKGLY